MVARSAEQAADSGSPRSLQGFLHAWGMGRASTVPYVCEMMFAYVLHKTPGYQQGARKFAQIKTTKGDSAANDAF